MKPRLPDAQRRLAMGLTACEEDCFPANTVQVPPSDTLVKGGHFTAGPFTFYGKPFQPRLYPVRITVVPARADEDFTDIYLSEIWMPGR